MADAGEIEEQVVETLDGVLAIPVRFDEARQTDSPPYCVVELFSGDADYHMLGSSGIEVAVFQVLFIAASPKAAKDYAASVKASMVGMVNEWVHLVRLVDRSSDKMPPASGKGRSLFQFAQTWRITYQVTAALFRG